jgi:glutathione S-transferase
LKLFNADLSPFAARCRIAIYAKDLDVAIEDPPGGFGSDAYRKVNPTGKVPALEIDGAVIPESAVINELLEDRFPARPLRPADPLARARMRVLVAMADHYVYPHIKDLFAQLDPKTRKPEVVKERLASLSGVLDQLERMLDERGPYAAGDALSLADCALHPTFFFVARMGALLGAADPVASRPRLARWWKTVQQNPAVRRVGDELQRAGAAFLGPK